MDIQQQHPNYVTNSQFQKGERTERGLDNLTHMVVDDLAHRGVDDLTHMVVDDLTHRVVNDLTHMVVDDLTHSSG